MGSLLNVIYGVVTANWYYFGLRPGFVHRRRERIRRLSLPAR